MSRPVIVLLLIVTWVQCHPVHLESPTLVKVQEHLGSRTNHADAEDLPFSPRRLEKMLEKAILKIITGDLSNADMLLLKSLNYNLEEVLAIRERELGKKDKLETTPEPSLDRSKGMDYEAYNRKAVEDYEMIANKMEDGIDGLDYNDPIAEGKRLQESNGGPHANFDRAMEPHVVFKIRYDDEDIDSSSFEKSSEHVGSVMNGMRILGKTSRHVEEASSRSSSPAPQVKFYQVLELADAARSDGDWDAASTTPSSDSSTGPSGTSSSGDAEPITKRTSEFEGLEWVEDDVYRVIPEALNYEMNNYEENDTMEAEVQPDNSDNSTIEDIMMNNDFAGEQDKEQVGNFSAYQQIALAHRRDQARNAIEDIKLRVLAMTGRFNLSANNNQVQRERLTMFSPTCEIPKNTDPETWLDPQSMNMYFQLNLTSNDHIVAARLRIYKLPQPNPTTSGPAVGAPEEEYEEEKKIRISVYFYTRSLKKHRSKKRLMDSIVTTLTSSGGHLALDVRQALTFWRKPSRGNHSTSSNNHGLLVQVEDQDGRPLKPASYIQQELCHANDEDTHEKAYQRVPAIFLQACSRYVRVVNGEAVTYVNCKNLRNSYP